MLLLRAFENRNVRSLFLAQLTSNLGDELYLVAFTWLSTEIVAERAGYLLAFQTLLAVLFLSFFGQKLDRVPPKKLLISLDLIRAMITMIPLFLWWKGTITFLGLSITSILMTLASAPFHSSLYSMLPSLVDHERTLKAANGLLGINFRLARIIGPMIVALLSPWLPMASFFGWNALSFLGSVYLLTYLKPRIESRSLQKKIPIFQSIRIEREQLKKHPRLIFITHLKGLTALAWGVAYGLGFALYARNFGENHAVLFTQMLTAYGIGNFVGAIYIGNRERRNPEPMIFYGFLLLGVTFGLMGVIENRFVFMALIALSAIGGPLNDLPYLDLVQSKVESASLGVFFRFRDRLEKIYHIAGMITAPLLFSSLGVKPVFILSGALMSIAGGIGLWSLQKSRKSVH